MFCTYCGAKLVANAAACSACGEPTSVTAATMLGTDATRLGTDATRLGTSSDGTHLGTSPDAMTSLGTGSAHAPQFGTRPSAVATLTPPGVPVMPGSPLAPGTAFGSRYHIIRLLGMGGMGAVYQAWDDELGVAVALKVIRPEITADPASARDLERRFKRELLLARQVTHKNVVRIHDLGEIDGIKYITMPYIQGSDLGSVLSKQGKLPVARAVAIAKQVVSGLVAAHEAGVVHRDLKPANIMIDEDDQAVIMDFGIARSVSGGGATVAGAVVGTLEYMAPEQAMAQPVDQRADVYAFGSDPLRHGARAASGDACGERRRRADGARPEPAASCARRRSVDTRTARAHYRQVHPAGSGCAVSDQRPAGAGPRSAG